MTRRSFALGALPAQVERALRELGEHLRMARKRRNDTLASFAERMQVSVPTLRKMERGDPSVSMAVYASALWLIGRVHFLSEIANPSSDETALLLEMRNLSRRRR